MGIIYLQATRPLRKDFLMLITIFQLSDKSNSLLYIYIGEIKKCVDIFKSTVSTYSIEQKIYDLNSTVFENKT